MVYIVIILSVRIKMDGLGTIDERAVGNANRVPALQFDRRTRRRKHDTVHPQADIVIGCRRPNDDFTVQLASAGNHDARSTDRNRGEFHLRPVRDGQNAAVIQSIDCGLQGNRIVGQAVAHGTEVSDAHALRVLVMLRTRYGARKRLLHRYKRIPAGRIASVCQVDTAIG